MTDKNLTNNDRIRVYVTENESSINDIVVFNSHENVDIVYIYLKSKNDYTKLYKFNFLLEDYEDIGTEDIIYLAFIKGYDRES